MLTTLRIKNLALVADLTLELDAGYTVITGETGAGKSILIGALSLVLGERADRDLIRSGTEACTVEAVFDLSHRQALAAAFLAENGLEPGEGSQLLLKRTFTTGGVNRQFINGSPTTLNILAALGDGLVDIHGPHDHQSLLRPAQQLAILDAFGGLDAPRAAFAELLRRRRQLESAKAELIVDETTYARQLDLLRHQVREIREANLCADEEESLQRDYQRAHNAARLLEAGQTALQQLSDDEDSLLVRAGRLGRALQDLRRLDPDAAGLVALHEQALAALGELRTELARYVERVELDPARLQALEERLNLLQGLKRKFGRTVDDVLRFGEEAAEQLRALESRDAELARLHRELAEIDADLCRRGEALHAQRQRTLPRLQKAVEAQLADLGFVRSHFEVLLTTTLPADPGGNAPSPTVTGFDSVEFQFAPNPGEPARPLRTIASSGEMARVMLALKTVLAAQDEIPVLVFDEVEANVGGETARAIGEKMRQLGQQCQVLCITHLAPVAACAQTHFVVDKDIIGSRTLTQIRRLDSAERVAEIARMLGGRDAAARRHAEALLKGPGRTWPTL
jgi:DNA repair protein RecN (Recombination protein N)